MYPPRSSGQTVFVMADDVLRRSSVAVFLPANRAGRPPPAAILAQSDRALGGDALIMLESIGEAVELNLRHPDSPPFVTPCGDAVLDLRQDRFRPSRRQPEIGQDGHERVYGGFGAGILGHPGLQFAQA